MSRRTLPAWFPSPGRPGAEDRSDASHALGLIPGADHFLDHFNEAVERPDHQTLAQVSARFFGLLK